VAEAQEYRMSDEEYDVFCEVCYSINQALQGVALHLIVPILVKMLVVSHMQTKGYTEETPGSRQLHDKMTTDISNYIYTTTNKDITERN
jgi:hypothetical protein